jgi:hypothetical protein
VIILSLLWMWLNALAMADKGEYPPGDMFSLFGRNVMTESAFVLLLAVPPVAGSLLAFNASSNRIASGFFAVVSIGCAVGISRVARRIWLQLRQARDNANSPNGARRETA